MKISEKIINFFKIDEKVIRFFKEVIDPEQLLKKNIQKLKNCFLPLILAMIVIVVFNNYLTSNSIINLIVYILLLSLIFSSLFLFGEWKKSILSLESTIKNKEIYEMYVILCEMILIFVAIGIYKLLLPFETYWYVVYIVQLVPMFLFVLLFKSIIQLFYRYLFVSMIIIFLVGFIDTSQWTVVSLILVVLNMILTYDHFILVYEKLDKDFNRSTIDERATQRELAYWKLLLNISVVVLYLFVLFSDNIDIVSWLLPPSLVLSSFGKYIAIGMSRTLILVIILLIITIRIGNIRNAKVEIDKFIKRSINRFMKFKPDK